MFDITTLLLFGTLVAILLQGLRRIPASPPHKGQLTRLGKRLPGKFLNEGWKFLPFYPYLFGFIPVKVERVTFDVVSEKTRTPDRSESRTPVSVTFRPIPELLVEYLDSGGEEGVKKQLHGKILERVREWASDPEAGPVDWIELNESHLEAISVLVRQITDELTPIPSYAQSVPTWIWLRYYSEPRPTQFLKNEKKWAENDWAKIKASLNEIELTHGTTAIHDLKIAVEKRRGEIGALRNGSAKIVLSDLGIRLERLNLGDIDVLGEVAKQAENEAKEEQERRGEEREIKFIMERMQELMAPPFNFTRSEARDIVQTERLKVVKTIDDKNFSLDATSAEFLKKVFGK